MCFKYPKHLRLLLREEFLSLQRSSQRYVGKNVFIESRKTSYPYTRLGITVSKRFGKAHKRNNFKRLIRESFRQYYPNFPLGFDVHVRPRSSEGPLSLDECLSEFHKFSSLL